MISCRAGGLFLLVAALAMPGRAETDVDLTQAGAPGAAPPRARDERRYGVEPELEYAPVELRAMELAAPRLQRPGDPPPAPSAVLTLAARQLAAVAARGEPALLTRRRLRQALWEFAASDPAPIRYLVSGPRARVAESLLTVISSTSSASFLGAGLVERDGTAWLVLLASPRRTRLRPFPRTVAVGESAELAGELVTGLADPRLFVTAPDGTVRELPMAGARRFKATIAFDTPGRWVVEVIGRGLSGPEVVALLLVSAGPESPDPGTAPDPPDPEDQAEAEAQVLRALNSTRRQHSLPPLAPSPALTALARAHSAAMLRAGLLTHQLPGADDTVTRVRRAGVPYRKVLENVAKGASALAAHEDIEWSPAHRGNLLVQGPTLAGVGIARGTLAGGGPVVYLTELLIEPPASSGWTGSAEGNPVR